MLRALEVLPQARENLQGWEKKAFLIPDRELRHQALASINSKSFHCMGGCLYGLLADNRITEITKFIIAYQTISDYLDNLCDRSNSLDPADFQALHESMADALTPGSPANDYYRFRQERDDGGYLKSLVQTCQGVLAKNPAYQHIAPYLIELAGYYSDLQINKHVSAEQRIGRLQAWFGLHRGKVPSMDWQEFGASAGSTLGIFALVSASFGRGFSPESAALIRGAYFPWIQGLHILLDYFIDQEEDLLGGDLNFCSFYDNIFQAEERILFFLKMAEQGTVRLAHPGFHRMICRGLPAIYLADKKVSRQANIKRSAGRMLRRCGPLTIFFYLNCWIYRRLRE